MLKFINEKSRQIVKEFPTSLCVCEVADGMNPDVVFEQALGSEEVELIKTLNSLQRNLGLTQELMDMLWVKIEEFGNMKEYFGKNS
jgi:hypothetical protein